MTAIPDLLAQRDAIDRQIDEAALPLIGAARTILAAQPVADILTGLDPIFSALPPGTSRDQIGNVLVVLRAVPDVLAREEAAAIERLAPVEPVTPPAPAA